MAAAKNDNLNTSNKDLDFRDTFSDPEVAMTIVSANSSIVRQSELIDEENWNYAVLFTRVFAILLLVLVIVIFSLGTHFNKIGLYTAGSIIGFFMVVILILSLYQFSCCDLFKVTYVFKQIRIAGRGTIVTEVLNTNKTTELSSVGQDASFPTANIIRTPINSTF